MCVAVCLCTSVQPALPGRAQPCPVCDAEVKEGTAAVPDGHPHELEAGAPGRRVYRPLRFVGIDAGLKAEVPQEGTGLPSEEEARDNGYAGVKDWYSIGSGAELARHSGAGS